MSMEIIKAYLHERKEKWLKDKIKRTMDNETIQRLQEEAEEMFSLHNWLPKEAKRAKEISMATHPPKFSNPSCKSSPIVYDRNQIVSDGLLRSGNVERVQIDGYGNAAAIPIFEFMTLILEDGRKVYEHIQKSTNFSKELLDIPGHTYENLRNTLLQMVDKDKETFKTCSNIKQVYYPVDNNMYKYHILSVLTNSGIVFELKDRLNALRSNASSAWKDRKEKKCNEIMHYKEIYGLTMIGYGGGNPRNISVLNNRYGGKAYLLSSLPPKIERRLVRFPKKDFFTDLLSYHKEELRRIAKSIDVIITADYNNVDIRRGRKYRYEQLMDLIITQMMRVRSVSSEQYREEDSRLPEYQKIWLCEQYREQRETQDKWLDDLIDHISRWILHQIESNTKRKGLKLGPAELADIRESVETSKEALR